MTSFAYWVSIPGLPGYGFHVETVIVVVIAALVILVLTAVAIAAASQRWSED